jgi:hypothetical protein
LQLIANLGAKSARLNQSVEGSLLFCTSELKSGEQKITVPENIASENIRPENIGPWEVRIYVRE